MARVLARQRPCRARARPQGCSLAVFFEVRKRMDLYLWMARTPDGPSIKFLVENSGCTGQQGRPTTLPPPPWPPPPRDGTILARCVRPSAS